MNLYQERLDARTAVLASSERRVEGLGNLRLGLSLLAVALVVLPLFTHESWPWWALIPLGCGFLVLGVAQDRAFEARRRSQAAVRFYREALDRVEEKWRALADDGADLGKKLGPGSAYAEDLDLFGPASLFQLLCRAETGLGRRRLGAYLVEPENDAAVKARQEAVLELKDMLDAREALVVAAAGDDTSRLVEDGLLAWAEGGKPVPMPRLLGAVGVLLPALTFAGIALAIFGRWQPLVVTLLVQMAVLVVTRLWTAERAHILAGPDRVLSRYARLFLAIEGLPVTAPALVALQRRLTEGAEGSASSKVRQLHRLVDLLDARLNPFFAVSLGPLLLWELNLVLRAERLRSVVGPRLRGWFDTIAEVEALASLAALAFERPDYAMPTLIEGPQRFVATGLVHPLIERGRVVANDVTLDGAGGLILLSGSNMSGKSTLLRAVGLASVLARAGAPVPARGLELSPMTLMTSVRVVDSLARGTSHFLAELQRIKAILDRAKSDPRLLYLLDEMLHGTNSRERLIGARAVVRWLSNQGALGIVTTHDLALASIAGELPPGRVQNQHFSDEVVDGQIRFDYRLRSGLLSSTNALRLMRAVGIDVPFDDDEPSGAP